MSRAIMSLCIVLLFFIPTAALNLVDPHDSGYVEGQILIKFRETTAPSEAAEVAEILDASLKLRIKTLQVELWDIRGVTVEAAILQLRGDPRIEFIEPNYYVYADGTFPNDPRFSELWGLYNTGENRGQPDADIDATDAWDIETGKEIVVGIVDTGVDYLHEDLADHIYINPGEIPGNGIDDDGNGYVDDVHGWDFVNNDNDPMDDSGHGTHVAGTVAAVGNNGIGVVGVSWSAKILPLKFLDNTGSGNIADAALAIEYANLMGIKLTNHSWSAETAYSQTLDLAVEAALDAGAFIVTSAGNAAINLDLDPRKPNCYEFDNIITVASTDEDDELASYSNYGKKHVDLGAPGSRILSCSPENRYAVLSGTSMSSPHVCGAISLIWAAAPSLSYLEVREILLSTVDPIPTLQGKSVTGGRLNIHRALAKLDSIAPAPVSDLVVASIGLKSISLTWTASGDDDMAGTAKKYDMRYSKSPIDTSNFNSATVVDDVPGPKPSGSIETLIVDELESNTTYYFALLVVDESGKASPISNTASGTTLIPDPPPQIGVSPTTIVKTLMTGGTAGKTVTIDNSGNGELEWQLELKDLSYIPGLVSESSDESGLKPHILESSADRVGGIPPPSLAPGILTGVTILFDAYHGQLQDSWNAMITDLTARGATVVINDNPITPAVLSSADILWATDAHIYVPWSNTELSALYDWVWGGGGLLLEGDNEPTVEQFNRILAKLGAGIVYAPEAGTSGSTANIEPHETTNDVGSISLSVNISYLSSVQEPAQVLLRDVQNEPAAAYSILGSGRIMAVADELFEDSRMGVEDNQLFGNQVFDWLARGLWLLAASRSGIVPPGGSEMLPIRLDAAALEGGIYEAEIAVRSNDPTAPIVGVHTILGVTAVGDIEISRNVIDFGTVYIGFPASDTVFVYNSGSDELLISNVTVINEDFTADLTSFALPPAEGRNIIVQCDPTGVGPIMGSMTITSNDPDEAVLDVQLQASGLIPPDIAVNPDSLDEDLFSDQRVTRIVTINNSGGSELAFSIWAESYDTTGGTAIISGVESRIDPGADRSRAMPPRMPVEPSGEIPDEELVPSGDGRQAEDVDLNVPFDSQRISSAPGPNIYFSDDFEDGDYDGWEDRGIGKNEVTSATAANFTKYSYHEYNSPPGHFNGVRYYLPGIKPNYISVHIRSGANGQADGYFMLDQTSGLHMIYIMFSSANKIGVNPGNTGQDISVEYKPNRWYWFELKNIDFESKTFDYYLDKILIKANMPFMDRATSDGIASVGLYNYTSGAEAWWDEIVFAKGDVWLSVDPASGTIPAGGNANVDVTIDATTQVTGDHFLSLLMQSNDPDEPEVEVPVNLHVTGVPNIAIRDTLIDFGEVIVGGSESIFFEVYNAGFEHDLVVDDISGPNITATPTPFAITPRDVRVVKVTLSPSVPGQVSGDITIASNDRDQSILGIPFVGTALTAPVIAVSSDSIFHAVDAGQVDNIHFEIRNTAVPGAADLDYTLVVVSGQYSFLTLDTRSSSVPPGAADTVGLYFDSQELNDGTYGVVLRIFTNIPDEPKIDIPVTLDVHGTPSIAVADTMVDFGVVYLGHPETQPLEISNVGTDTLIVSEVTASGAGFFVEPDSFVLLPDNGETVEITCNPPFTGAVMETLTITCNDTTRSVLQLKLAAEVLEAPRLFVEPDSITLSIREGAAFSTSISLANNGASNIEWELDLAFVHPDDIPESTAKLPSKSASVSAGGLKDVLWYGEHGMGGIAMWSTIIADLEGRGWTVTQSSDPLSAELLAQYDILWLGDMEEVLTASETDAVVGWLLDGGGLLIETDNAGAIAVYNVILNNAGSGIAYANGIISGGLTPYVLPHETTFGVGSIFLLNPNACINAAPPSEFIVQNAQSLSIVAHSTAGKGRILAMADQLFTNIGIGIGDTRIFANQVFGWLAGVNWLSIEPWGGMLTPGAASTIDFEIDASRLLPGAYQINVEIDSNDPANPVVAVLVRLTVEPAIPRTVELSLDTGLNLRSWNVDTNVDSTAVLIGAIKNEVLSIQGFDGGGLTYDPSVPPQFNTLQMMDHLHGYWIRTTESVTWLIDGFQINHQTPIYLSEGYNLVGYLPDFEDSTAHALMTIHDELIVALGYDQGGLTYDPNLPPDFNTLKVLKPGYGYWVKLDRADTLVYPEGPAGGAADSPLALPTADELPTHSRVNPTREWISVWGDDVRIEGDAIAAGTVITALDGDGIVCGESIVKREGQVGLMAIYRDDPDTEADEGADEGEDIAIVIGEMGSLRGIRWTGLGDVVNLNDNTVFVEIALEMLPKHDALHQNFPNPFNPMTAIRYDLKAPGGVRLDIYNIRGERVRRLLAKRQNAGRYTVYWDGRNDAGASVASGIYFCKLETRDFVQSRKMILLK